MLDVSGGQSLVQFGELGLEFGLSALAGLAAAVTALYFIALYGFPWLVRRMPRIGVGPATLRLSYEDGRGVLRRVLERCASEGFSVAQVAIDGDGREPYPGVIDVVLVVFGRPPAALLAADLEEVDGVLSVTSDDPNAAGD